MQAEDYRKLIDAGIIGEVELLSRHEGEEPRVWCGNYEMTFSTEQIAAAAELGVDLRPHGAPAETPALGDEPTIDPDHCAHFGYRLVYTPDPGDPHGSHTMGVETCTACGSSRRVEGDHDGPWFPPGVTPSWDDPATGSESDQADGTNAPSSDLPAAPAPVIERSVDTRGAWFPTRASYEHLGPEALAALDDFAWTIYCLRAM